MTANRTRQATSVPGLIRRGGLVALVVAGLVTAVRRRRRASAPEDAGFASRIGGERPSAPGVRGATPGRETRSRADPWPSAVYPAISAPEAVALGRPFEVTVGLADRPAAGVVGDALALDPSWIEGDAAIRLQAMVRGDGFSVRDPETAVELPVERGRELPTTSVTVWADAAAGGHRAGTIEVRYQIDGNPIGDALIVVIARSE